MDRWPVFGREGGAEGPATASENTTDALLSPDADAGEEDGDATT